MFYTRNGRKQIVTAELRGFRNCFESPARRMPTLPTTSGRRRLRQCCVPSSRRRNSFPPDAGRARQPASLRRRSRSVHFPLWTGRNRGTRVAVSGRCGMKFSLKLFQRITPYGCVITALIFHLENLIFILDSSVPLRKLLLLLTGKPLESRADGPALLFTDHCPLTTVHRPLTTVH